MDKLVIEQMSINDITPNPKNARSHSKDQLKQLEKSIQSFGVTSRSLSMRTKRY